KMGSLFRSEEMCLAQLYLQSEAAFACVSELGELGLAQFRDLNPDVNAFQRKFVNEVRRCDDMERKLRKFFYRILVIFLSNVFTFNFVLLLIYPLPNSDISLLANKFDKLETEMKSVNSNQEALKKNFLELTELKHILRKTQQFFEQAALYQQDQETHVPQQYDDETPLIASEFSRSFNRFGFVAGVLMRDKISAFERVIWRACRGNVFLRYTEIEAELEDPHTGDKVNKYVFIVFFQGDQLKSRIKKICTGFRATLYPCPETPQERREIALGVMTRIEDLQTVLNQTADHRRMVLSQVALNIRVWLIKVRKIKAIYHTLNLFNVNAEKCLIAECWCPVVDIDRIQLALRRGTELSGSSVPSIMQQMQTKENPPTYNQTDKFTSGFQAIIDAFGVSNYREVNPAPFTIITFPFLFAVMFGDMGHGLLMFLFALYLVLKENRYMKHKPEDELRKQIFQIFKMMFDGRYLILLMGLFSIYTGFLYNECFSRSINIFGTSWNVRAMNFTDNDVFLATNPVVTLDPNKPGVFRGYPYFYGIDPIWQSAENKITVQNSYKMKNAVLMGFAQMIFGLSLAFCNRRHFKDKLTLYCELLPQLLFLCALIGYLCMCILYKWSVWTVAQSNTAPSLLIGLIDMYMLTDPKSNNRVPLYTGQYQVQIFLVIVTVLCVPWMFLSKPYILYKRSNNTQDDICCFSLYDRLITQSMMEAGGLDSQSDDDVAILHHENNDANYGKQEPESFDMSEVIIYQAIHTIEFCLSCISHTASYLRLWALSLAHSELSEVLWSMVMHTGLATSGTSGAILSFFVFWFFSSLTVSILLVMEGLSAFLHAIRLHWVEFQSKFYKGEGYIFSPFSF
uniref:V-type proton ATPase subunit a n=1 Tax=Ciona savignyi TaxID=51511 RepID=H2ZFW7_CIOSA